MVAVTSEESMSRTQSIWLVCYILKIRLVLENFIIYLSITGLHFTEASYFNKLSVYRNKVVPFCIITSTWKIDVRLNGIDT